MRGEHGEDDGKSRVRWRPVPFDSGRYSGRWRLTLRDFELRAPCGKASCSGA